MTDILEKLADLRTQATTENSHFYVAGCCEEAMAEIRRLRAETPPTMPLNKALHILTEAHTRDNEQTGFTVETLPQVFEWGRADYVEAWRSVRFNVGKQTEPNK